MAVFFKRRKGGKEEGRKGGRKEGRKEGGASSFYPFLPPPLLPKN